MFKKKNNKQQLIQNPTVLYWRIKLLTNIKKMGVSRPSHQPSHHIGKAMAI